MPLVGFHDDTGRKVTFEEAWQLEEFAGLPVEVLYALFLEQVKKTTRPTGLTVTGLLGCPRKVVMQKQNEYYDHPRNLYPLIRGCVTPDTPILTSSLCWVPAGTLKTGAELLAFDENLSAGRRKMRLSYVVANEPIIKTCVRIITDRGVTVASEDHPVLVRGSYTSRSRAAYFGKSNRKDTRPAGRQCWVPAKELAPGDKILFVPVWENDLSYEGGYIAGALDGEGHVDKQKAKLTFTQRDGLVLQKIERALTEKGYAFGRNTSRYEHYLPVEHLRINGGRLGAMQLLGSTQPIRLVTQFRDRWDGTDVNLTVDMTTVIGIEPIGQRVVAGLETSTKTYIANGLLSHNTMIHKIMEGVNGLYMPGTVISEERYERLIPGTDIILSGQIDRYDVRTKTLRDYKTIRTDRVPKLEHGLPEDYPWQANIYAWLLKSQGYDVEKIRILFFHWDYALVTGCNTWFKEGWDGIRTFEVPNCPVYSLGQVEDFIVTTARKIMVKDDLPPRVTKDKMWMCKRCPFYKDCWGK